MSPLGCKACSSPLPGTFVHHLMGGVMHEREGTTYLDGQIDEHWAVWKLTNRENGSRLGRFKGNKRVVCCIA